MKDTELFFRMDPDKIPWKKTDPGYSDFWKRELEKVERGIEIDGFKISGWLYWHLNHWRINSDKVTEWGDIIPEMITPKLRDNEIILNNEILTAEQTKKGIVVMGLRQFSKSTMQSSYAGRAATIYKGSQNLIMGTSTDDLNNLTQYLDFGLLNVTPYFRISRISTDWTKERVLLGAKKKSGDNIVYSQFIIRNTGAGKKTEKGAGVSNLKSNIWDEIGKEDFLQALIGTKPAMLSEFGWRCIPLCMGCVCAGTKVWDNNGNLINIEDLIPDNGILGFKDGAISKEVITYWQEPKEKECFRIETNKGTSLECSWDHPILMRHRNKREVINGISRRKLEFIETKSLKIGDHISLIESVPLFSNQEMWEPRLVGWLIGDGSYGMDETPVISNCDESILDYIKSNFNHFVEKSNITKEGKIYEEIRIKNICKELRSLGIYGQTKSNKTLPKNIHSFSKNSICELIGGIFDTDGCIYSSSNSAPDTISLTASHQSILNEVKLLLIKLGIHSRINFIKPRNRNRRIIDNGHYVLSICDRDSIIEFYNNITLSIDYKQNKLVKVYNKIKNRKRGSDTHFKGIRFERITNIIPIGQKPVYNLTAGTSNTYIANGIITHNTGGNIEKAKDAKDLFFNPESHNFIAHSQDDGRVTGLFLPGWLRQDCKVKKKLAEYLIETGQLTNIPNDSELWDLDIDVSDKEKAIAKINKELDDFKKAKDTKSFIRWKAYYPLEVDDIFLQESNNNFPIEACKARKKWLELNYQPDYVDLYRDQNNQVCSKFSTNSIITKFPVGPKDVLNMPTPPISVFEYPDHDAPKTTYVIGIDPINEDASSDKVNSLASIYVRKRMYKIGDPWANKIVASWTGRCKTIKDFHSLALMIAEWYGAELGVLPENEDKTLIQYFFFKKKGHYLAESMDLAREINPNSKSKRQVGLSASTPNQKHYMSLLVEEAKEETEITYEDGSTDEILGVENIFDPMLLEEYINYRGKEATSRGVHDGNFDRIIAAGHALTLSKYYDIKFRIADYSKKPKDDTQKKPRESLNTFFGEIRPKNISPFGTKTKKKPFNGFGFPH